MRDSVNDLILIIAKQIAYGAVRRYQHYFSENPAGRGITAKISIHNPVFTSMILVRYLTNIL